MAVLLLIFFVQGISAAVDPCVTHGTINEPHRSTLFEPTQTDRLLCDRDMTPGWYKFDNHDNMPTSCIQKNHCGTSVPVWLNGALPPNDGQEHSMKACMNYGYPFGQPCCQVSLNIKVKNCGNFHVYYLVRTPGCSAAYCAGDRYVCDIGNVHLGAGQTQPNTCTNVYPKLTQFPILEKPTTASQTNIQFGCKIPYQTGQANVGFDVSWTVDDHVVTDYNGKPIVKRLTGDQREAFLDAKYLYNHLNSNLKCNVTSYYLTSPSVRSDSIHSNKPYYLGFTTDKSSIIVNENGPEQTVTLESTLPVPCSQIDKRRCKLTVKLKATDDPLDTSTKDCTYDLIYDPQSGTWKTTIKVKATRDFLDDKDKTHLIAFENLTPTDPNQAMFFNASLPSVQVHTKNVGHKVCTARGDPHIETLENKHAYNLYHTGDFIFYKAKNRPFEVQIRNWDCGRWNPCICAVVAREGNDVIEVDNCPRRKGQVTSSEIKILSNGPLSGTTWIPKTDKTGKSYYIDFPSGARLVVNGRAGTVPFLNVHLEVPSDDLNAAEGICGTFDGNSADDYTGRDGVVHSSHGIDPFVQSWRIKAGTSMFDSIPKHEQQYELGHEYCTCTKKIVDCTKGKGAANPNKNTCHTPCVNIPQQATIHRRDVSNHYSDHGHDAHIPVDQSFLQRKSIRSTATFPTATGITEIRARQICFGSLTSATLYHRCQHMPQLSLNSRVDACVEDIKYSGSTIFNIDHMNALDDACASEVMRNVSNYRYGADNFPIPPDDVTKHRCPYQCSLQGTCVLGKCHCHTGWMGDDCSIKVGVAPVIHRIRGDNACDKRNHPCQKAYVIADNIHHTANLKCKYKQIQSGQTTVVAAEFFSSMELACPLPPSNVLNGIPTQTYEISVSTDGVLYSHISQFTVFDSHCQECDIHGNCSLKPDSCLIDGHCHRAGEQTAQSQECVPSKSTTSWTTSHAAQEIDHYTASFTGCPCPFDNQRTDCACCQNGGCQCGEIQMNQCVACDKSSECATNPDLFPPPQ